MRKIIKIGLVIGIAIILTTPISMVLADDTEPPVITSISFGPHAGVRNDPGFYLFQSCNVTDNVSVAEVRINITGPIGFTPINDSMVNINGSRYYYEVDNVSISGTYEFFIWANDTSNNTVQSNTYHMLVFENYLSYIHVDVNNTNGPWNGTAEYPLRYIPDALAVLAPNGTIFIHEGTYGNTSILVNKNMNLLGENQETTILDGDVFTPGIIVQTSGSFVLMLSNLTLRNALIGIQAQNGSNLTVFDCSFSQCTDSGIVLSEYQHFLVSNTTFFNTTRGLYAQNGSNLTVSDCSFSQCTDSGIILSEYQQAIVSDCRFQNNNRGIQLTNCSYNQFYHNNFINNTNQVSCYSNTSHNTWDNNVTGNYWDNYRVIYPNASIIPGTGTWDTPYVVNASGNNTDYHPWVYPSGHIDTIPPQVTVLYPNGGEVVSGEITIQWYASDDFTMDLNGTILLEYSADNGSSWIQLASQYNNTGLYLWNTTNVLDGNLYLIRVSATDEFLNIGSDTSNTPFSTKNYSPGDPQINGPSQGGNGIIFNFTAVASDPQGEQIYYKWDWGDGNESDWLGPFDSNLTTTETYTWANDGNYSIRVKARNAEGTESNWSAPHLMFIAEQINFSNVQLGTIYIKLFSFNRSFIFSDFLARLGVVIILTSHQMELQGYASDIVQSVTFKADNQYKVETMEVIDDNGTDGFSCFMNVSRGIYTLNITALDENGTLIDKYSLVTVFFIRIGKYAVKPEPVRLQLLRGIYRLRHQS